jgi:hypothetical protein
VSSASTSGAAASVERHVQVVLRRWYVTPDTGTRRSGARRGDPGPLRVVVPAGPLPPRMPCKGNSARRRGRMHPGRRAPKTRSPPSPRVVKFSALLVLNHSPETPMSLGTGALVLDCCLLEPWRGREEDHRSYQEGGDAQSACRTIAALTMIRPSTPRWAFSILGSQMKRPKLDRNNVGFGFGPHMPGAEQRKSCFKLESPQEYLFFSS